MKILGISFLFLSFFISVTPLQAQETDPGQNGSGSNESFFKKNIAYQLQAYYSLGGSAPLGLPRQIRSVQKYNPGLQLGLQANATKWWNDLEKWGLRLGVSVEGRGMTTQARTKAYLTRIIQDNGEVMGYYTGIVHTKVNNTYTTIPVSAVYNISERWNVYGGPYVSFAMSKDFNGYVKDGYLRQDTPNGQKITFTGDSRAIYDFTDQVQTFQWGLQVGAEWQLKNRHFNLFPRVNYGANSLLNRDFNAISFHFHNIYLDLGFAYKF